MEIMEKIMNSSTNAVISLLLGHKSNPSVKELVLQGEQVANAFVVNDKVVMLTKYGTGTNNLGEYQFCFRSKIIDQLIQISLCYRVRVILICENDARTCEFSLNDLLLIREARAVSMDGINEDQF